MPFLARKPQLCVVDELAHTNAPGSRHEKRYQDVLELLDAGISVMTAVNIQHLETLNDLVSRVTGVRVRETVPDTFLDRADEVINVDVTVDELRTRLRQGRSTSRRRSNRRSATSSARATCRRCASWRCARSRTKSGRRRRRYRQREGLEPGADSRAGDGLHELERERAARHPRRRAHRVTAGRAVVRRVCGHAAGAAGADQPRRPRPTGPQHRARREPRRDRRARRPRIVRPTA